MDKSYLENQMGVKLYTLMEFAEFLGWSHQRLSKTWVTQQKGKTVRNPLPNPVHTGYRGSALLWTEGQVKKYQNELRPNSRPEWREIDGKQVFGRVCRRCDEFKPIEDMAFKHASTCYTCDSLRAAENRRRLGETTSEYKPRGRVHVRVYDATGKIQCRSCKIFKDESEFKIGANVKPKPDCRDCINTRRRELYAADKGDPNE